MSEKIAVVTGGTSGIGAATVALLRSREWQVVPTGFTDAELATDTTARFLDVRDTDAVAAFFAGFDTLHGLVNAAGTAGVGDQTEIALFEEVIDVNLTGTMRCASAARAALAEGQGAVVNVASVLGLVANGNSPAYAASKAGVVNLTRSLAARWAPEKIRVVGVAPGYIETPMTTHVRADTERSKSLMTRTALGRWGQPEEIAQMVAWLLSDQASYVTGSTHLIDGGYCAT